MDSSHATPSHKRPWSADGRVGNASDSSHPQTVSPYVRSPRDRSRTRFDKARLLAEHQATRKHLRGSLNKEEAPPVALDTDVAEGLVQESRGDASPHPAAPVAHLLSDGDDESKHSGSLTLAEDYNNFVEHTNHNFEMLNVQICQLQSDLKQKDE